MQNEFPRMADVWYRGGDFSPRPGLQHLFAFIILGLLGIVVGTLGCTSIPVGFNISFFWPAITLQVVGGLWFGAWGVGCGVLFGFISNLLSGGTATNIWGFIPANLIQSGLTAWVFRRWRLSPCLQTSREVVAFILVGAGLSSLLGAMAGMAALIWTGDIAGLNDAIPLALSWIAGNSLPCVIFGIPLLFYFSPLIVDSPFFCNGWWGSSRRFRWKGWQLEDFPVVARLLLGYGGAGVLPILLIALVHALTIPQFEHPSLDVVVPVMLNLSIFLSLIVAGRMAQSISRRVRILAEGAQILGGGDLAHYVSIEGNDELGQLAGSFNKMAEDLIASREELRRTTAEQERYLKELEIAHNIQQSFLPQHFPEIFGYEIAACNIPARHVGGDFYDFIPLKNGRCGLLVADVSDKGIPAALFMALSRSLIRAYSLEYDSMADALQAFNAFVEAENPSSMFVTLFYATLEPEAHRLIYVNAGHNPPILLRSHDNQVILLRARGVALGVLPEVELDQLHIHLDTGDVVVLYTDGVTEAFNSQGEMFGLERLIEIVRRHCTASAKELVETIKMEVAAFAASSQQSDDITVLVICCK